MYEEIYDQAAFCADFFALHLKTHGGKPDPNCDFCKGFILPSKDRLVGDCPLESYKFLIIDISDCGVEQG